MKDQNFKKFKKKISTGCVKLIRKQQMLLFLYCATNSFPSTGISKILCTSKAASATCTYVRLSDILQLGTNVLWCVVMDQKCLVSIGYKRGFFINEQIFLIIAYELSSSLFCFFMYINFMDLLCTCSFLDFCIFYILFY